jgi:hypothetical protein
VYVTLQQLCNKPFNLRTPEDMCVGVAIASLYNFTTILGPQSHRYVMAELRKGNVAGAKFVQQRFFQRLSIHRYIWIPFACSYNPYVFVTFFTYEHMSVEILLEPLDVWIWLSYCSFLIFTVLCIGMLKGNTGGNRNLLRRASDAFMWTISVTLEQSDESINTKSGETPTQCHGWGFILLTYISCTGCVLTAFAVGLAYKTALFSCLTAKLPPPVPKNVQELYNSGLTYGTTTRHFYNGTPYSTLKDIVIPDQFEHNAKDVSVNEFNVHFHHELVFFNETDLDLVSKIAKGSPVKFDNELRSVPTSFAVISTMQDVRSLIRLMSRYSYHKYILNKDPSPFMTRYPWYGFQNFFSENLSSALARLHESGICERWRMNYEIYEQINMTRSQKIESKAEDHQNGDIQFLMMMQANKALNRGLSADANNNEQPISLSSVLIVFVSCGILLILGTLILFIEKFFNYLVIKIESMSISISFASEGTNIPFVYLK